MEQQNASFSLMQHLNRYGVTLIPNLLLDAYHDLGLDEQELSAILHLLRCHISAEGSLLSLSDYLMGKMRRNRSEISFLLKRLQNKSMMQFQQDPGKLKPQDVSLQPLYAQLLAWSQLTEELRRKPEKSDDGELIRLFESHFRHLSEFEYERLRDWLNEDGWPPEVIREALRIAALGRNLNFKYIDRVLDNWKRKGCNTLEQVLAENAAYERRKLLQEEAQSSKQPTEYVSASRSRRKAKSSFRVGSINQGEESEEERKKRFDKLIE